jgi:hypothetical protein
MHGIAVQLLAFRKVPLQLRQPRLRHGRLKKRLDAIAAVGDQFGGQRPPGKPDPLNEGFQ